MKVIDLLNKIANGEEVPNKYRYKNNEYEEDYCYMLYEATGDCNELGFKSLLNDEIEIIEDTPKVQVEMTQEEYFKYFDRKLDTPKEDKKIEHINKVYDLTDFRKDYPIVAEMLKDVSKKQYEIIDRLNGEEQ